MVYLLASGPSRPGSVPNISKKDSEEWIIDASETNQWHCLEESGQWLENVDRIHLVLASGKLGLEKKLPVSHKNNKMS